MKNYSLLILALFLSATTFAQKWTVDKAHSKLGFQVTHMTISEVDGDFKNYEASITNTKSDFTDAQFTLVAEVNSINTENEMRDNILKGSQFFDVAKYPTLSFKSTSVTKVDDKNYTLTGDLTIHGVTKKTTFNLTINGFGQNMMTHKPVVGLKITGAIHRSDFGLANYPSSIISEEIKIKAIGEFDQ